MESATNLRAAEAMRKIRSIKAKKCELCGFVRAPGFKRKMKKKKNPRFEFRYQLNWNELLKVCILSTRKFLKLK